MTAGTFAGGTFGLPFGGGIGLFFDNTGRAYPQLYGGTPGPSADAPAGGLPGMLRAVMQQGQAQQGSDSLSTPNGAPEINSDNSLQGGLLGMLLALRGQAPTAAEPSEESPHAPEKPCRCLSRRLAD
jgi:hypothetical protein